MPQVDLATLVSIDLDEPAMVPVDPLQESRQRRLSGPAAPDDAKHRARGYCKCHAVERGNFRAAIGKTHVVEGDCPGKLRSQSAGKGIVLQWTVQHRSGLADRGTNLLVVLDESRQHGVR